MRIVNVVTNTLSFFSILSLISPTKSSICPSVFLTSIVGSNNPVGRMICSTNFPPVCSNSKSPGVADT